MSVDREMTTIDARLFVVATVSEKYVDARCIMSLEVDLGSFRRTSLQHERVQALRGPQSRPHDSSLACGSPR